MELYTWNVIFIAVDLKNQIPEEDTAKNNAKHYLNEDAIEIGIERFKKSATNGNTAFKKINIHILEYQHEDLNKEANIYIKLAGETVLRKRTETFNCHSIDDYCKFFSSTIKDGTNQKYVLFFLAHSFGAGFVPKKNENYDEDNLVTKNFSVFSIPDLNTSIQNSFINVDCLIGLNCQIQTIESNIIFKDTLKYFIGSQQPLFIKSVYYDLFLRDLDLCSSKTSVGLTETDLFIKFIYDCEKSFAKDNMNKKLPEFFSMALTKPKNSLAIIQKLNLLANCFEIKDGEISTTSDTWQNLRDARFYAQDPSASDLVNIIDAVHFFTKFKELTKNNKAFSIVEELLDKIRLLIFHTQTSGNSVEFDIPKNDKVEISCYIPHGIGVYIPKVLSPNQGINTHLFSIEETNEDIPDLLLNWNDLQRGIVSTLNIKDEQLYQMKQILDNNIAIKYSAISVYNSIQGKKIIEKLNISE